MCCMYLDSTGEYVRSTTVYWKTLCFSYRMEIAHERFYSILSTSSRLVEGTDW